MEFMRESEQLNPRDRAIIRQEVFDAQLRDQWHSLSRAEQMSLQQMFNNSLPSPLRMPPVQDPYTKQVMDEIRPPWGRAESGKALTTGENVGHVLEGVRRGITPPSLDQAVGKLRGFEIPASDPRSEGGILPPFLNLGPAIGKDLANYSGWASEGAGEMAGIFGPGLASMLMKFPRLAAPVTNYLKKQFTTSSVFDAWKQGRAARAAQGTGAAAAPAASPAAAGLKAAEVAEPATSRFSLAQEAPWVGPQDIPRMGMPR